MYEQIGGYHIIRKAGAGGFAEVFEAYDSGLDRIVAIKICPAGDARRTRRFEREARILSSLRHPNIAVVHSSGRDAATGQLYLVGEFLSGVDLQRKIRDRDALPPILRVRYLMEIVQGLSYLHGRGLIHRDLSPANVRVLADHSIRLMDFGLAKASGDATLTEIDENFASIGYAPPEQMSRMKSVDHRADLFAFGVIAYELLTYQHPFFASNAAAISVRVRDDDPRDLRALWPSCPSQLAKAVHKCLEKEPEDRFQTAEELLEVLEGVAERLRSARFEDTLTMGKASTLPFRLRRVFGDIEIDQLDLMTEAVAAGGAVGDEGTRPVRIEEEGRDGVAAESDVADLLAGSSGPVAAPTIEPSVETSVVEMSVVETPPSRRLPPWAGVVVGMVLGVTVMGLAVGLVSSTAPSPSTSTVVETPAAPEPVLRLRVEEASAVGGAEIVLEIDPPSTAFDACYVLREPAWTVGLVRRFDAARCAARPFVYRDRRDLEPGDEYTYTVRWVDGAGEVAARSAAVSVHMPGS